MKLKGMLLAVAALIGATASANVVIYDDEPANKSVSVSAGDELEVRGSGLTANCTLTLGDGAKVKFYTTATIAAPISSSGTVTFETADSTVTGTVSGKLTAAFTGTKYIDVLAPGLIRFTGGATLGNTEGGLRMKGGTAEISGAIFDVGCNLFFNAGRLIVRDGGGWKCNTVQQRYLYLNQSQTGDACLELAVGGYATFGNNDQVYVGGDRNYESKLLVNGGSFIRQTPDAIHLNSSGAGNGVIEIAAGLFQSERQITCGNATGSAKVVFGNGKWTKSYNKWAADCLVNGGGSGLCEIVVNGDFTLDISGQSTSDHTVVNDYGGTGGGVKWTVEDGASLNVVGQANGANEFVMHGFSGDGLVFDRRSDKSRITIADAAQPLEIGWFHPAMDGARLVAAGTSPELSVSYVLTSGQAAPGEFADDSFVGFSAVSFANVIVSTPANVTTYVPACVLDRMTGALTLESGNLTLDSELGAGKLVVKGGSVRYAATDPVVLRNTMNWPTTTYGWKDASGTACGWTAGAVAQIETMGGNGGLYGVLPAYKVEVGGSGNHSWDGSDGRFEIGAGGLEFTASKAWALLKGNYLERFLLTANQTWTNSAASGTAYMQLGFGYNAPNYHKGYMRAAPGVTDWRLGGNFETWLYSPSNDLHDVTVTVSKPATIRLVRDIDARLHAKKLVLDGAEMAFGRKFPISDTYYGNYFSVKEADSDHVAPEVVLKDGGRLAMDDASGSFAIPRVTGVGAGNAVVGTVIPVTQEITAVTVAAADDELAFDGIVRSPSGARFDVNGQGRLVLRAATKGDLPDVNLVDGGTVKFVGAGRYAGRIIGQGTLEIAGDGRIDMSGCDLANSSLAVIEVTAGTLMLASGDDIPSGVKVRTAGAGALLLVDPTGFDPETRMEGTKKLAGTIVITDEPREDETVSVGAGETLLVCGNGLKASSSVVLADGASVLFAKSATIQSTVSAQGAVTIGATKDVTGRIEGSVSISPDSSATFDITGAGMVDFAGGVAANAKGIFRVKGGNALVSAGKLSVTEAVQMLAGTLTFSNATLECGAMNAMLDLARPDQFDDVKVTFLKGSYWLLGNNQVPKVGKVPGLESRIVLDGGTWETWSYDLFYLCQDGTGIGIFEMKDGVFKTNRRLISGDVISGGGTSKVIWSGGTYTSLKNTWGKDYQYAYIIQGPLTEFLIAGDCTLDLYRFTNSTVKVFENANARLRATQDATLTIKSESSTAGWCNHVVLNGFDANGLALNLVRSDVNGDVTVDIPDVAGTVELGWAVGGQGTVNATGTSPALVANYIVPNGAVFSTAADYSGWNTGFSSVQDNDLVFKEGSQLSFPIVNSAIVPFGVAGALKLPPEMKFLVDANVRPGTLEGVPVIVAAKGIEGDCTWTCAGGLSKRGSHLYAEGNVVKLDYDPKGMAIIVR